MSADDERNRAQEARDMAEKARVIKYARAMSGMVVDAYEWQRYTSDVVRVLPMADAEIAAAVAEVTAERDEAWSAYRSVRERMFQAERERDTYKSLRDADLMADRTLDVALDRARAALDRVRAVINGWTIGGSRDCAAQIRAALADDAGGETSEEPLHMTDTATRAMSVNGPLCDMPVTSEETGIPEPAAATFREPGETLNLGGPGKWSPNNPQVWFAEDRCDCGHERRLHDSPANACHAAVRATAGLRECDCAGFGLSAPVDGGEAQ